MLLHDVRSAIRSLLRARSFAAIGVATVALAAGMATSVFSVVNAVLLRPLPYRDPGRLAMIWSVFPNEPKAPVSFDDLEDWRRGSGTLETAALFTSFYKPILTGAGTAERISALLVSHEYFDVMGVRPLAGRFFTPEEDRDGRDDVVVLSSSFWRAKFRADPGVVGRTIRLNGRPHLVVGVAGPDLLPLPAHLADEPPQVYRSIGVEFGPGSRDGRNLMSIARLRSGASLAQAQAELNVRSKQMARENPVADAHLGAKIITLRAEVTDGVQPALLALQGAVLLLVLIACANIANLLLARSTGRTRELAIRRALGAGTARLARLLLAESLVLGLVGGVGGLLLAGWSTAILRASTAQVLPDAGDIAIDSRVLLFSIGLSAAAAVLFGMAPVFHLRATMLDDSLRHGGRVAGDRRSVLRQALAATQIALAMVLLVSAGLLGRSFLRLRAMDPGFDPHGVITAAVALPQPRYTPQAAIFQFMDRALEAMRGIPGVTEAALVTVVPMSGDFDRTRSEIEGRPAKREQDANPDRYIVTPGYFAVMRIPLRQGRLFDEGDGTDRPPVCIISETAARLWFPGESPLGRRIRAGAASGGYAKSPFREVVGVVGDVAQYAPGLPPTPQIYMPHRQYPDRYVTLVARTGGDAAALGPAMRSAVLAADSEQPAYNIKPLEQIVSNTLAARRLGLWLIAVFAASALTLAAIGIYGVVSYSVARRTAEFGIRVALGAAPGDVIRAAAAGTVITVAAGLTAGIAASLAVSRLIAAFLFQVSSRDAAAFGALPVFLAMVALLACYVPARRAARVDPAVVLRSE